MLFKDLLYFDLVMLCLIYHAAGAFKGTPAEISLLKDWNALYFDLCFVLFFCFGV